MGIYSNAVHEGYNGVEPSIQDTLESIMLDESIEPYEGEDFTEGALAAVCDIHENYNLFMSQIGIAELAAVENTGSLMVYNEGVLGDMVNAIKNFLKKIWEKIKSLFKRFMMMVDSYTKNDKEFVQKYKKEIYSGKGLENFTFKGWKFKKEAFDATDKACDYCSLFKLPVHDDGTGELIKAIAGEPFKEELLKKLEDNYDDIVEAIRGDIVGELGAKNAGKLTSSEFTKELHAVYRNSEDSKEELDENDIKISDIANELMTSADTKKTVNKLFKDAKRVIDADTKLIEKGQNTFFKTQPEENPDEKVRDTYSPKMTKERVKNIHSYDDLNEKGKKKVDDYIDSQAGWVHDDKTRMHVLRNGYVKVELQDAQGYASERHGFNKTTKGDISNRRAKSFSLGLRMIRDLKSALLQVEGACLNALKERSRQNKAIIIKYVSHKPKKESGFTESVQMGYTPFSNIVLR